jgi:hypothetical protein
VILHRIGLRGCAPRVREEDGHSSVPYHVLYTPPCPGVDVDGEGKTMTTSDVSGEPDRQDCFIPVGNWSGIIYRRPEAEI